MQICSQNEQPPKHENTTVEGLWMRVLFFFPSELSKLFKRNIPSIYNENFFLDLKEKNSSF